MQETRMKRALLIRLQYVGAGHLHEFHAGDDPSLRGSRLELKAMRRALLTSAVRAA
jgi:hypothetical protein